MDVGAWLRDLGLERYEPAFRDNEIDAEILPKLTADDLRDMGVTVVGHRRKLLEAIAALPAPREAAMPSTDDVRATPAPGPPAAPPNQAERRQLTVMFADLVGSTALAGRLDPEDMGAVLRAYQDACAGEITRFEGHVAKYMGDGVLAYFGYPRAHEDAAERAVRAGLDITAAVGRLAAPDDGAPLAARIGIATGLVVVGDLIGKGAAQEQAVVGETPNLAARLQALAAPGSVVIGSNTRHLIGGVFEVADLGLHQLKGFAAPVGAWRVLGPGAAQGRFEARQAAGLTPLVGRAEELALLLRRWQQARDGAGQIVLLAGEPGIGKSRLIRALRERLDSEAYTALLCQCSPYHTQSALHPVIDQIERAAGFARDDPLERRLAKLEALLAASTEDIAAVAPLFAALLSLPTERRYPPLELTPRRQKELTLQALLGQLEGLAARQPVLVVLEDAHWSDPTTQEFFGLVIERPRNVPVLVIVTFRPEYSPPWAGDHPKVTQLTLSRLSRRQCATLVERVAGGKALPEEALAQIVAKTDGVPLFVEELTKTVLESGLVRNAGDRYAPAGPLPPFAIPATLQDSLMARLDRLALAKEVAQIGAAIGREFSYELLAAVTPLRDDELQDALGQLCSSELVFCRGAPPEASYSFKHALVQDVAYQSLLRSKRQQLHARIIRVLEERFAATAEADPELLAHHCTQAGLAEKAVGYWRKAGQRAIHRSAMGEAVAQLRTGIETLKNLPGGEERDRTELELQVTLGVALVAARGQPAPETGRAYVRARALAERLGEMRQLFRVLYGLASHHGARAELSAAREAVATLLGLARERHDVPALIAGHRMGGVQAVIAGKFAAARAELERALALYDPVEHQRFAFVYGQDPWASAAAWLAWPLLAMGYPEQALAQHRAGLARAREVGHPNTLAQALFCGCTFRQLRGEPESVGEQANMLGSLAEKQAFPFWSAMAAIFKGWLLAQAGESGPAIAKIESGLAAYRETAATLWLPYFLALLAEAPEGAGQPAEACRLLDDALDRVASTGERWYDAELHRRRGELLLRLPEPDLAAAEACFCRAIAVAHAQSARMWELRAATSLARLWRDQGRCAKAWDLLAPIHGWFSEGFDTPDLQGAKALLDELR